MSKVKAKFKCQSIQEFESNKNVSLYPVMDGSEENKSFAKYTPGGGLTLNIDKETPAADFFTVGKEYYLDIYEA